MIPLKIPNERTQTHRAAIKAVLGLLTARGFGYNPFTYESGEKIRVTSYQGRRLAVPYVNLLVHGANLSLSRPVVAPDEKPVEDEREMVVCVSLSYRQFLFLTNDEAAQRWHTAGGGGRAFYSTGG